MMSASRNYVMIIDLDKCIGCYACQVTCKMEHDLPLERFRIRLTTRDKGAYTNNKRLFLPVLCSQCTRPECMDACPKRAILRKDGGIVTIDRSLCIGCGRCLKACEHGVICLRGGRIEKCDFCYERVKRDRMPVCVMSCMSKAMSFGDINNSNSLIWQKLKENADSLYAFSHASKKSRSRVVYIQRNRENAYPELNRIDIIDYKPDRMYSRESLREDLSGRRIINTVDRMCPAECGISVMVKNGRAIKIYGNRSSINNSGTLCARGASGLQLVYSPHRIKKPLLRAGKRGDDRWKAVSWKQAFNLIAEKLISIKKRYGAESIVFDSGDVTDAEPYYRLFHALGTPNVFSHTTICDTNRQWGHKLITGDERPLPDLQRPLLLRDQGGLLREEKRYQTRLLMNIGVNPLVSTRFNFMSRGIAEARIDNECFYVVVDPSFTNSAAIADVWLPITPGNDHALLASMLYYIIAHDDPLQRETSYVDHDFIKNYTTGWEEFKKLFLEQALKIDPSNGYNFYSLEWGEKKTGIPKEKIEYVSHLFGIMKPASMEIGMHGTAHHSNGDVASILMTTLCTVTGNIDIPGGLVFTESQKPKRSIEVTGHDFLNMHVTRVVNGKERKGLLYELHKDLYGDFPLAWKGVVANIPENIRNNVKLLHGPFKRYTYPLKALFVRMGNPVMTGGNTDDWIDALTLEKNGDYSLELSVFLDTHINETGKYADVILPECSYLERIGLSDEYTINPEILLTDRVIKPLYESKSPFNIMKLLSKELKKQGDREIGENFSMKKYRREEDFIDALLEKCPSLYNIGDPLPYPELPEGALIIGTPDDPYALKNGKVIKEGELLTVKGLRKTRGRAIWPASYYRYRTSDGRPSGIYPNTESKRFEFVFSHIEDINSRFNLSHPVSFHWRDSNWNPKNVEFFKYRKEFPFQLITGRTHHTMTMTQVCPYLLELETETQKKMNDGFDTHALFFDKRNESSFEEEASKKDSFSIPIFLFNKNDGKKYGIKTGDLVTLENPEGKRIRGKGYISELIKPCVIKTTFGSGGRDSKHIGFFYSAKDYTPNPNLLFDKRNITVTTGMPGFGDIMVKIVDVTSN